MGVSSLVLVASCAKEREPEAETEPAERKNTSARPADAPPASDKTANEGSGTPLSATNTATTRASVQPLVELVGGDALRPLAVAANRPLSFKLGDQRGFHQVFLDRFIARTPDGNQISLDVDSKTGAITHTFPNAGATLLCACFGPKEIAAYSNAWERVTRCTKILLEVGGSRAGDAGELSKVGSPLEILPIMSPLGLRVGDELPVRAYVDLAKAADLPIQAYRPDGSVVTVPTDKNAVATFKITHAGRWTLRFEQGSKGAERMAEFVFQIQEGQR